MSLLDSIIYGLISGLAELLPVSALSHQTLLLRLMGETQRDPIRDLFIHIAVILALITACRPMLSRLQRERRIVHSKRRGIGHTANGLYDLRLIKTAAVPLIICSLLTVSTNKLGNSLIYIALFSLINGLILIAPEYMRSGNKDARSMTGLDGIIFGLCGALSVFPGISRIACLHTYASARGVSKQNGLNWALLLSIPALVLYCAIDILGVFTVTLNTISFSIFAGYIFSALSAFLGGYAAITIAQFLTVRTGFSGFAYYSLGLSFFSMILYLIA